MTKRFWRLETSSKLFYDFSKTTEQQNLFIFSTWYYIDSSIIFSTWYRLNTLSQSRGKLWAFDSWLLSNWSKLVNLEGPGMRHQSSKWIFPKSTALDYIYYFAKFHGLTIQNILKIYAKFKICPKKVSCLSADAHQEITDYSFNGMLRNSKNWIFQELKMTFLTRT